MDVVDDGVGFAKQLGPKAGIGMESMRERMELIGGAISIKSAPMKGTKIQASVPLDRAA
jgi:signal transduction histidine kinase